MAIAGEARQWTEDLWMILMVVWVAGMFVTRPTVRRQSSSSRFWQGGIVVLGAWLLFGGGTGFAWMDAAAFAVTAPVALTGAAVTLAGVAFAIWARAMLGANWSGIVTVKAGHTLVRRGPYRLVRHPIYTGILLGLTGTMLTRGSVHSILALPVCAFGFWLKSVTEEQFMVQQFGSEYMEYRREVRALVPYFF